MTFLKRLARARRAFLQDLGGEGAGKPDRRAAGFEREYFYLSPELALTRQKNGLLLYVDPLDETMSAHLIGYGYWEPNVYAVVTSLISPGDVVVEVGANVGYYTVAMGLMVGAEGRIHTFEANARLAGMVQRSSYINGLNDRVTVHPKAVMETPGSVRFERSRKRSGWGHVAHGDGHVFDDSEIVEVEAASLDSLGLDRVDLIRLDAEGSEALILRGASVILAGNPDLVICMEWDPTQMGSRADLPALVSWLSDQGFRLWRIEADASLAPIPMDKAAGLQTCDVVISRKPPTPAAGLMQ